jgi:hypothetical protein
MRGNITLLCRKLKTETEIRGYAKSVFQQLKDEFIGLLLLTIL